jgi:isoquinoline 1-oxidoreductase subunit beta
MTASLPSPRLSRRGILAGGAGLTLAFALGAEAQTPRDTQTAAPATAPVTGRLNAYVTIHPDGGITIMAPAPEMGQATNTTLPLVLAEELDADWARVRVRTAPVAAAYDHPVFRSQFVVASLTTRAYWMPLRIAGAQARRVLLDAVAERWKVPVGELTTEPSVVVHAASNRRIGYGEIARFAVAPATLPEIKPTDLKPVASFRLIGKDVARWDVPAKSSGREDYAIDVRVLGMVYGLMARAPVMGAKATAHNGDEIRKMPGVSHVVPLADGVVVVAARIDQALAARAALKVEWGQAPGSKYDSTEALKAFQAAARDPAQKGVVGRKTGEAEDALKFASKVVAGEYSTDYVAHAQMEPLNAVASVTADGVEVWVGTQWPSRVRDDAAKIAGVQPDKVKVNMMPMGGGFGRRAHTEYANEAVEVAKVVGKPVKLICLREDDMANSHMRPMTAHRIEVGLDEAKNLIGWKHRVAADLVVPNLYGQARMEAQKGVDHIVMAHADVPYYDVGSHLAEHVYQDTVVRTAAWRGIGAGPNAFAIESMIDELAREAGQDPLAYRLALLKDARAKAVVQAAAEMAEWPRKREGSGLGIAFARLGVPQLGESMAAVVVEAKADPATGRIGVERVWCAADVGLPVQPRNIAQQVQGSLIWGLSSALTERATFKNGAVEQSNYTDYPVMRMSEMPRIEVRVVRSGEMPLPVGELGLGAVAPAIANAVAALTGKRLRNLPFTAERVKTTLQA